MAECGQCPEGSRDDMEERIAAQRVPVKMYRSNDRLMIAAPMPGLEATDLHADLGADGTLRLRGELRGALKGIKALVLDEWSVGDYERDLMLPESVDGTSAVMTYGNGVAVIALPVASRTTPAAISCSRTDGNEADIATGQGKEDHRDTTAAERERSDAASDPVTEASLESFPASDPPAYTQDRA
jgi:HSP20 family protein